MKKRSIATKGGTAPARKELPTRTFRNAHAWESWLSGHHDSAPGLWLRFAKKGSRHRSVTYSEALDVALCHGWIDSQKKGLDADWFLQKFTPRGARSLWSKVNQQRVQGLTDAGRMQPPWLAEVDRAKADGRWAAAYDSHRTATVPDDLRAALDEKPNAAAFFETLDAANRYAILWRVQTAVKAETRERRIAKLLEMLERGEKLAWVRGRSSITETHAAHRRRRMTSDPKHRTRLTLAAATMVAIVATVSSCTRPATPPPDAGRAVPPEAAPVGEEARARERTGTTDPAFALACAATGRVAEGADSVALRITAAFLKAGILPIRLSLPSTGGVDAGPVELSTPAASRVSARATTEVDGDSTGYRVEVRIAPPTQGWAEGDSAVATAHAGALCGRVVGVAFS